MDDIYVSKQPVRPQNNIPAQPPIQRPPRQEPPKRKKSRIGSFVKAFIAILLVLVLIGGVGGAAYVYFLAGKVDSSEEKHVNEYVNDSSLVSDSKVTNILLIGIDGSVSDSSYRSDVMMLLSVDRVNKKIKLTSFLRDMWVSIPGKNSAKLNAACAYGNAPLVMDTIEYNFGIDIENYMLVDFDMFETIVDALGGVDVEVTKKESKHLNETYGNLNPPVHVDYGESVHMDGYNALFYCRIRTLDSDFMRTSRQRKVLTAIIEKAKKASPSTLMEMLNAVLPNVKTDLSQAELTKLALGALLYIRYDIEQQQIPADGAYTSKTIKGQSALSPNLEKNKQILKDFIYAEDTAEDETTTVKQK